MDTTARNDDEPTAGFRWDGDPEPATARVRRTRSPRRHPAKRSRLVAGMLSAAAFLGIVGSMAARSAGTSSTAATTSSGSSTSSDDDSSSNSSSDSSDDSGSSSSGSTGWSAVPGSSGSNGDQPNSVSHAS